MTESINRSLGTQTENVRKTWQQWFREVTGVEGAFSTGKEAGELYAAGVADSLLRAQEVAAALGQDFDLAGTLRSQMAEVQGDLEDLLMVPVDEIDEQFALADESVQRLVETYRELESRAKTVEVADTISELQKRVDELGKSEADLTLEMLEATGAPEEQLDIAAELLAKLNETTPQFKNWQEELTKVIEQPLNKLGLAEDRARSIIAGVGTELAAVSFDGAIAGFSELGETLGDGAGAAESLRAAMAAMSQQILQQLPMMFLQAGLQLIAQGQWALGLGLIAASASTSILSGYVNSKTNYEEDEEENAKGRVYGDEGYTAFSHGGFFSNKIVDSPTLFRFSRGGKFKTGLMGEAGPEAIMPLRRTSDGRLGVAAAGATGLAIEIVINNYSSETVDAQESTGEDGKRKLEITIGAMINQHLSKGNADKAMSSRYGIKAKGV